MSNMTQIKIDGLKDLTSTAHLEKTLEAVPGVRSVEINPDVERAIVAHEGVEVSDLVRAAWKEGFRVSLV